MSGFAGEVISSLYTYSSGGNVIGNLLQNYTYDNRGRICSETATLYKSVGQNVSALKRYVYDDLGRVSRIAIEVPGGVCLNTDMDYTLQGWVSSLETSTDGEILFAQNLGYDSGNILSGTEPSYTGLITRKDDIWFQNSQQMSILTNGYTYDYAGRLASEVSDDLSTTEYGYDARGNLLSVLKTGFSTSSIYSGDVLTSVTSAINGAAQTVSFVHDALGRMTYDGTTGQAMTYNTLDLIGKVSKGGTVLANYFYLADGTKIGALDGSGEGLVYRGPFVYRRSTGSGTSSLTLESAAFGGGRLTPSGAMLYVTDYLGSVRAVVNGGTGAICKASDYSPYGEQSDAESMQTASTPAWITFRDAYTGKEDQHPDFGTGYTDFGARQYSPALRRWMAPDPLSEKYYGISQYAFCNDNPLRYVDPDGKDGWDVFIGHSIGLITNVIPGTGSWRDSYSPTDPMDYNLALRNSDLAAFKFGGFLTKVGVAEAAFGGAALAAGATSFSVSGGTLVFVGGPVAAIGGEELVKGVVTAAGGSLMMMNSSKNQLDGYERGKPSNSNSDNKPKSINQLETDIQRGKAPKGFKHFHNMHTKGGQEHVHLEDGTSLNKDGSWKDGKNSQHKLTNKQIKYLQDNGWDI